MTMTTRNHPDSFKSAATLTSGNTTVNYFRLGALAETGTNLARLPFSLRILLENLLRCEDGRLDRTGHSQFLNVMGLSAVHK